MEEENTLLEVAPDGGVTTGGTEAGPDAGGNRSATHSRIATDGPERGEKQAGEASGIFSESEGSGSGHAANGSVTAQQAKTEPPEDRRARYRALVSGEFKDLYTADTQRIIDRRFKETRSLRETLEAQQPVLERVMERYGVDALADLADALEAEQAKERADREERERRARERQERWSIEVEETRGTYPQFDWEKESSDLMFQALLESGVPVKLAYEAVHMDQVKADAVRTAEKRIADDIRARGTRPQENGTAAQNAVAVRPDVSRLTPQQRRDIARRAAHGEEITFR